jgi:hypothetical protein
MSDPKDGTAQKTMELLQTLDDAWDAQDWDTFDKRHRRDVVVRGPGSRPRTADAVIAPSRSISSRLSPTIMSATDRTTKPRLCGQWRASRDGNAGILGNPGIVGSVTYGI